MPGRYYLRVIVFLVAVSLLESCQKEIAGTVDGTVVPVEQKPKVGTIWTYRYYTYYATGGLHTSTIITHKAKNEENVGGETWLNIIDVAADTTVYLLNEKTGGLYQYANNSSNLFCKYPAAVNDTYNTFNSGAMEFFTVRGVNDTLPTGIGNVPANNYEGVKGTDIIDVIWYNKNAWIVRRNVYYRTTFFPTVYYKRSSLYLDAITY